MFSHSSLTSVFDICAWVCDAYSQYCSLGLCIGTVMMLDEGQVLFSRVQLDTTAPLTLQYTRKVKKCLFNEHVQAF